MQINSDCQKPLRFALRLLAAGYLQRRADQIILGDGVRHQQRLC